VDLGHREQSDLNRILDRIIDRANILAERWRNGGLAQRPAGRIDPPFPPTFMADGHFLPLPGLRDLLAP
jgi:hypothetical protein